jgi:hypothetical protein
MSECLSPSTDRCYLKLSSTYSRPLATLRYTRFRTHNYPSTTCEGKLGYDKTKTKCATKLSHV